MGGGVFVKLTFSIFDRSCKLTRSIVLQGLDYNTPDTLQSSIPADTLRLAFRYGINTIDTSPYYTCSEEVLGRAFSTVADEFPRESYQIITKAGRYGRTKESGFDYSPARTRESIANSLKLFKTSYLDGVYMHDVEFVSEQVDTAGQEGWTVDDEGNLREEDLVRWGLGAADAAVIRGPGDQNVLDAMRTLFELKKEGLIRCVGFSGRFFPPRDSTFNISDLLYLQVILYPHSYASLAWSLPISNLSTSCSPTVITPSRTRLFLLSFLFSMRQE